MKRMKMETKIAITFFVMFIAGVAINGIYSVVSMNSSFFTFDVLKIGFIFAVLYLCYIWICTRRHTLLAIIGWNCIWGMIYFFGLSDNLFGNWNLNLIYIGVKYIYDIVAIIIAFYQSEKLLEEDNATIESNQRALIREEIENAKREEH